MIVYFFKKSKKAAQMWGIFIGVGLVGVYMIFVLNALVKKESSTIQIIRQAHLNTVGQGSVMDGFGQKEQSSDLSFVASKRGVYYYPINCSKAKALSTKNMLYFKDKIDAEHAGYKAHKDCF